MDIIPVDLADDVVVKELFEVFVRCMEASRVDPPRRTPEEFAAWLRFDFPGERKETVMVRVDGVAAGLAELFLPERDNVDKCWVELKVHPAYRRRGVGGALAAWAEERGRSAGRAMLLTEVFVPAGRRETHPDRRFAEQRGYRMSSIEIGRSLPLPVDADLLAREDRASAEAMGDAYEVQVHLDGVPEELRQGVCDASNRLMLDAPTGDVEFEQESMTVEDYATMLAHQASLGNQVLTAVAVHRESGVVAAYTDLVLPAADPSVVFQWGTLVLPEHRGHRLGMAVKVANLLELERRDPGRTRVKTMNDEQNPWMVKINVDLGFRIVEEALSMRKDL
jgi:GNAT superfamily N-acetyltransferase